MKSFISQRVYAQHTMPARWLLARRLPHVTFHRSTTPTLSPWLAIAEAARAKCVEALARSELGFASVGEIEVLNQRFVIV